MLSRRAAERGVAAVAGIGAERPLDVIGEAVAILVVVHHVGNVVAVEVGEDAQIERLHVGADAVARRDGDGEAPRRGRGACDRHALEAEAGRRRYRIDGDSDRRRPARGDRVAERDTLHRARDQHARDARRHRAAGRHGHPRPPGAPAVELLRRGRGELLDGPQVRVVKRIDARVAVVAPAHARLPKAFRVGGLALLGDGVRAQGAGWVGRGAEGVVSARELAGGEAGVPDHDVVVGVHADARVREVLLAGRVVRPAPLLERPVGAHLPPLDGGPRGRVEEHRVRRPQRAVAEDTVRQARVTGVDLEGRAELREEVGDGRRHAPRIG